jgi:N-acetylglucosamine-6-phosphate deacetylase
MLLIHNATLATPDGTALDGWLLIDGSQIAQFGGGAPPAVEGARWIDAGEQTLLPGFIDVHVHGSAGADAMDATPDALLTMARFFASRGVTSFLATTMTHSGDATSRALEQIAATQGRIAGGATLLGAHLEGPYINVKMKGAQDAQHVRLADPAEYLRWLDLNTIRQVTLAPEFAENVTFLRECVKRGLNVSLGHTQASYEQVNEAVRLGARHATHTYNAMTGLHHRNPGTLGGVLAADEVCCEVIADKVHVHPAPIKILVRAKGVGRVIAITDAIRAAGMGDGLSELGGQPVVVRDGMATLADGTLAGSVLTMDQAVRNLLAITGLSLVEAAPMFGANAARQLGLGGSKGQLKVGYDADLTLLDADGIVQLTLVAGEVVYRAPGATG